VHKAIHSEGTSVNDSAIKLLTSKVGSLSMPIERID
jgi:hypothetical protein